MTKPKWLVKGAGASGDSGAWTPQEKLAPLGGAVARVFS